jgi:nitrite reductase/ring-hydroxylating ferredoxin subunit
MVAARFRGRGLEKVYVGKRRSFLKYLLLFMGSAFAMMLTWGTAKFALLRQARSRQREVPAETVARVRTGAPLHVPEAGAWLWRNTPDSEVMAVDDRCSHLGCRVIWNTERRLFECPCHGSQFDREGGLLRGPASRSMSRLTVTKDESGKIVLKDQS